jgi:hypothetical protein
MLMKVSYVSAHLKTASIAANSPYTMNRKKQNAANALSAGLSALFCIMKNKHNACIK